MNAKLFSAVALALLISAQASAQSQPPGTTPASPTTGMAPSPGNDREPAAADRSFLDEALKSGETEIHAAKLAQQRGMDEDVRELAQLIERDHRDLNAKLEFAGARSDHASGKHNAAPATTPATTPGIRPMPSAAPAPPMRWATTRPTHCRPTRT
jgi:predicted outer membrane protein